MDDKNPEQQAVSESYIKRRVLWHSDRDAKNTVDYYADRLTLIHIDDGEWALELACSGHVVRLPIKNIEKYV